MGLLAVLVEIDRAGSVSAAAEKLNLSQPAVSHALRRLRELTGDQLIIRDKGRMVKTIRAREILSIAPRLVEEAKLLLAPKEFDPKTETIKYRFSSNSYSLFACIAPLQNTLSNLMPGATFYTSWISQITKDQLIDGNVDFVFTGDISNFASETNFASRTLFYEEYVGVMSSSHPLVEKAKTMGLNLEEWLSYPHVAFVTSTQAKSSISAKLEEKNLTRKISTFSPDHNFNIQFARDSDCFYSCPSRLIKKTNDNGIVTFRIPLNLSAYPVYMVCHKRSFEQAAHRFVISCVESMKF